MPDIGNNGASIDSVEISGLTTSINSYNISYNKSVMKIYSNVPAPINGTVNLTGLPVDTDGTLAMKGSTGYYAEIIPPAGAISYDVTPKLFGMSDPDGNFGFIFDQPSITEIKDANGKTIGLYFVATPKQMDNLSGESMNIRFTNVVMPTYTVTYNANGATGGTVPTDVKAYHKNDVVTLLGNTGNLKKTGFTFGGWSTSLNGTAVITYTMSSSNVNFYAVWNLSSAYTVTYNANGATGGTVPTDTHTYAVGETVPVTGNTGNLIKTGCTFGGWSTSLNGTAVTTYTMSSANVNFYAVWKADNNPSNPSTPSAPSTPSTPSKPTVTVGETPTNIPSPELISANPIGDAFSQPVEIRLKDDPKVKEEIQKALEASGTKLPADAKIFPLDISLYIKGTNTKVQPKDGTSVEITCPIPKELLSDKDNLFVTTVVNGKLQIIPVKVVIKNGVPCVVFTVTHFSPYAFVIDKGGKLATLAAGAPSLENTSALPHNSGIPYIVLSLGLTAGIILFNTKRLRNKK